MSMYFFFQAEDGIRDLYVTGVQTCALPIYTGISRRRRARCPGVTPEGAAHGARGASQYPAEAVTAGRGFAGPGTLARGVPARSGDAMSAPPVRRRMAGLEWGAPGGPSCRE